MIQELGAGGCYGAQKDVFRTCPGASRKALRQATKHVGAGDTPVQKFLKVVCKLGITEVKESILGNNLCVKALKSIVCW